MRAPSRRAWQDEARRAEDLGFDTSRSCPITSPTTCSRRWWRSGDDGRGDVAAARRDLRAEQRLPPSSLAAAEAATIDLLTDGRLELGLGQGRGTRYAEIGFVDRAALCPGRRLSESAHLLRRLFDGDEVSVDGTHYRTSSYRLPPPLFAHAFSSGNGNWHCACGRGHRRHRRFPTGLERLPARRQRPRDEWQLDQIDTVASCGSAAEIASTALPELNALIQYAEITKRPGRESVAAVAATRHRSWIA